LKLTKAIDKLIEDIESSELKDKIDLIVFNEQYAEILWVGNHDEYDSTFKGNKKTIENMVT
jgi:hypothetical protein